MTSSAIGSGGDASSGDGAGYDQDYEWEINYGGVNEIEEEFSSEVFDDDMNNSGMAEIESDGFWFDGDDVVYVAVGRQRSEEGTSMDALVWALNNAVVPNSTLVYLIHVFPETKYIPTPLVKLPISQVNPEQKENYMAKERVKRREYLHKFLTICSASQVKVDTILIESDMETKAILDLIPILNIRKLVLGTTMRRMRSRRGNGVVTDQILQNAPEYCEVKIICEGKEMSEYPLYSPSPSPSPRAATQRPLNFPQHQQQIAACCCFKINYNTTCRNSSVGKASD